MRLDLNYFKQIAETIGRSEKTHLQLDDFFDKNDLEKYSQDWVEAFNNGQPEPMPLVGYEEIKYHLIMMKEHGLVDDYVHAVDKVQYALTSKGQQFLKVVGIDEGWKAIKKQYEDNALLLNILSELNLNNSFVEAKWENKKMKEID